MDTHWNNELNQIIAIKDWVFKFYCKGLWDKLRITIENKIDTLFILITI